MTTQKRLITTVGNQKCSLGCTYCFVDNINYTGFPKLSIDSKESILSQIDLDIQVLQPSADVELFMVPNWLEILEELAKAKKHISFATKSKVSDQKAELLSKINHKLNEHGAILNIAVSITTLEDNWKDFERHTPSPQERIETLGTLYNHGIPTTVAIRPLFPFLTMTNIDRIVEATFQYTYGYLSGPLYLTEEIKRYLFEHGYNYEILVREVSWLPEHPMMEVIESRELEDYLTDKAKEHGLPIFESNIQAVLELKERLLP